MPDNIEIKAVVRDADGLERHIQTLAGKTPVMMVQEDIFFNVPQGRLKLRMSSPNDCELIYYERPDDSGPKRSSYFKVEVSDPQGMKEVLTKALGIKGSVRKTRKLYLYGQTRIHLDEVEGLGSFLELEVMLGESQRTEDGIIIALDIMNRLHIEGRELVVNAYIDLLLSNNCSQAAHDFPGQTCSVRRITTDKQTIDRRKKAMIEVPEEIDQKIARKRQNDRSRPAKPDGLVEEHFRSLVVKKKEAESKNK